MATENDCELALALNENLTKLPGVQGLGIQQFKNDFRLVVYVDLLTKANSGIPKSVMILNAAGKRVKVKVEIVEVGEVKPI